MSEMIFGWEMPPSGAGTGFVRFASAPADTTRPIDDGSDGHNSRIVRRPDYLSAPIFTWRADPHPMHVGRTSPVPKLR